MVLDIIVIHNGCEKIAEKKPFQRIVLPIDGSKSSLKASEKSIDLSKKLNLPLTALFVIEPSPLPKAVISENQYDTWDREIESKGQHILNDIEKKGKQKGIDIYTMLLRGTPHEEIITEADQNDLIIMGRRGYSSAERIFIGSVSEQVLHHAKSAVMIVK